MSKRLYPNPAVSWPLWKNVLVALFSTSSIIFLSWGFSMLTDLDRYKGWYSDPPTFPPLRIEHILAGVPMFLVSLWSHWAWCPRHKHARWHRWAVSFVSAVYISVLLLAGGMSFCNAILAPPRNWVINGTMSASYIAAWMLPALSYRWSRKIVYAQDDLGLKMLAYGTPAGLLVAAGIVGATYGRYAYRHGETRTALLILAIGFSIVAVAIAQYNAARLWDYRPWVKEDE